MAISPCKIELRSEHLHGRYCLATFPQNVSTRHDSRRRKLQVVCANNGTNIFNFGTVKKTEENSEQDSNGAFKFGTQLLKLGTVKKSTEKLATTKKDLSFPRLRRSPDSKTVFVAGATGQIGARISQQLLRSGFNVRAGVRDLAIAQQLAEFATQYGVLSKDEARRLNAVECEFKEPEAIAKAIGNAGSVVVTVGPTEDGPRGKVTPNDALQVVEAASLANVGHVVIVTESGDGSTSENPFSGITGFFNRLFSGGGSAEITPESLLESVVDTDLRFTFLKTSSTDVDDFIPNGSILLLSEGTYNEGTGKVSKSQLASVVAGVFQNISVAENKVVEVTSLASASPRPVLELLSAIPEDGRRAALKEARAKAEAEEREKSLREQVEAEAQKALEDAQRTAAIAGQLEQEAKKLATKEARAIANAEKAKAKAQAAGEKFKEFGLAFSFNKTTSSRDEETSSEEEDDNIATGITGFLNKTFSSRSLKNEDADEVPQIEDVKKTGLGNFFSGNRKVSEPPTPQVDDVKKSGGFGKIFSGNKSAVQGEISNKKMKQPVAAIKPKPVQKGEPVKILGGIFQQETIYVDD